MTHAEDTDDVTVLVVEDDRHLATLFTDWLEDAYEVRTAYTGSEALELLDPSVDVVLLDRRLPDTTGDAVLTQIRERSRCRVALVTAVDPDETVLDMDVDEYVTKPTTRADLLALVEELAGRRVLASDVQQYLALASRKETLESEQSLESLLESTAYRRVVDDLADRRGEVTQTLARQVRRGNRPENFYSLRQIFGGIVLLGLVGAALVAIHLLVPDGPARLVDSSPRSNPLLGYPASVLHQSDTHLYGNVAGFLFLGLLTYVFCLRSISLEWFYLSAGAIFLVVPPLTYLLLYGSIATVAGDVPVLVGFSGVVSAFVGFSFLSLLTTLRLVYEPRRVGLVGGIVLLTAVSVVLWVHEVPAVLIPAALTVGLFVASVAGAGTNGAGSSHDGEWESIVEATVTAAVLGGLYAALGLGVVPAGFDTRYSLLGHLIGLGAGVTISLSIALAIGLYPVREWVTARGYPLPTSLF